MINLFHVQNTPSGYLSARLINFTDYREFTFTEGSFIGPASLTDLKPGFLYLRRDTGQKYKVTEVRPAEDTDTNVHRYRVIWVDLAVKMRLGISEDPITRLKEQAEVLHFRKKHLGDFWKNKTGVFLWLMEQVQAGNWDTGEAGALSEN